MQNLIIEEFERISEVMTLDIELLHADLSQDTNPAVPVIIRMDSMEIDPQVN